MTAYDPADPLSDGWTSQPPVQAAQSSRPVPVYPSADPVAGTPGLRTLGSGAQQAAAGNHSHTGLSAQSAGTPSVRALGTGATEAAAGNHTHPAQVLGAAKTTDTARNSTTTTTDDPDLTVTLTAGTWKVDAGIFWKQATSISTNDSLKSQLAYSGTLTSAIGSLEGAEATLSRTLSPDLTAADATESATGDTSSKVLNLQGIAIVSTGGALSFQWAQKVSASDVTSVQAGSYLTATKIA